MTSIQNSPPLTEATYFVMLSLAAGPRHGYGIMKDVEVLSSGRVLLSTGTLYGVLKRLLEQGWIERAAPRPPGPWEADESGRPRKCYSLTSLGHRILQAEVERLRSLITAARLTADRGKA